MMGTRNGTTGIWKIAVNIRNNGVSVRSVVTGIGMCGYLRFCLEATY